MRSIIPENRERDMRITAPDKNLLPITDVTLHIINVGIQEKNPQHKIGPILRSEHILQYVTDGKGFLEIDGKTFAVQKGDMFYLPKNVLLQYWANQEDPYTYHWLGIDGVNLKKLLRLAGFSHENPVMHYADDTLVEKYKKIDSAICKNNFAGYIQGIARSYDLLAYLLKKNKQNLQPLESESMRYVNKTIKFIHDNYNNDISVSTIAKHVGLCRNYLSVIFKREMGISPIEYLVSHRISKAQILLRENVSVTETAINCGFNSISNFSTQFKRVVGVSPYTFQKNGRR